MKRSPLLHRRAREQNSLERPINDGRDGLNLGAQLLLDAVEVEPILVGDEVDGESEVAVTSRTSDSVKVRLGVLGEIKVDDDVDGLDVDTTGEEIC